MNLSPSGLPYPLLASSHGGHWNNSAPTLGTTGSAAWVSGEARRPPDPGRGRMTCLPNLMTANSPTNQGDYSDDVCDSPVSTVSDESLHNHRENATPADSPHHAGSPIVGTTAYMARVSLDHGRDQSASPQPNHRGRGQLGAASAVQKRSASTELPGRSGTHRPGVHVPARVHQSQRVPNFFPSKIQKRAPHDYTPYDRQEQFRAASIENPQRRMIDHKSHIRPFVQSHNRPKKETAIRGDSGYVTAPSRENTGVDSISRQPATVHQHSQHDVVQHVKGVIQMPANGRYPGLILQPDSSPISQEQLAAEVKGIYAGLVMVEAKCINIDATQTADIGQPLGPEQWQALIALHRTLLYEHHDFLMATQHPSATPALRGLATKYNMPARMWKHGIHAFLEMLRARRPESQEYMLAFIYLAYQMMALLFETVPSFTDTWIECLGDLARYRMAIEEEKEIHAAWGCVAARWYTLASDRHPAIGRLYHHLGILERPSLRKLCLYAKSLTCVIPFTNARDSLRTLCDPIVRDELKVRSSGNAVEARIVTFHALVNSRFDASLVHQVGNDALKLLHDQHSKIKDIGAYLAITNIAALFELGSPTNMVHQQYNTAINRAMQQFRPSIPSSSNPIQFSSALTNTTPTPQYTASEGFWADCFNTLLHDFDPTSLKDVLPFVHVTLVGIHSLHLLRARLVDGGTLDTYESPVDTRRLDWVALADFLNTLAKQEQITSRVLECARQGKFLLPERKEDAKPLSEDYLIRGLIWGQFYFSPGWFDGQSEDDGRGIETQNMQTARAQRVLWLGLYLAFRTEHIQFDVHNKVFTHWSMTRPSRTSVYQPISEPEDLPECQTEQASKIPTATSRSSLAASSSPSSEDGFLIVKPHKILEDPKSKRHSEVTTKAKQPSSQSWAKVAAKPVSSTPPRKQKQDMNTFKVYDEDGMVWSADGDATEYRSAYPGDSIRSNYTRR